MNMPADYNERISIVDRITNQKTFTFDEILNWESRNMLQQGDHFIIDKDGDYWFSIIYLDNQFYAVTGDPKLVKISRKELSKYTFYNKNLITSSYQDYIRREGLDNFNKLSLEDKCDVYVGNYFTKRINETLDGLKDCLNNLINTLQEDENHDS